MTPPPHRPLHGKTAIITGGGSGQGRAIATALAAAGCSIAIGSFTSEHTATAIGDATYHPGAAELDAAAAAIRTHGVDAIAAHLDVCCADSVDAFTTAATTALGAPAILVNAAGTTAEQPVAGHSEALWQHIINTNLSGAFRMTRACLPAMLAAGWGRIINIASTAATAGWQDNPAYCASKAGLLGLTRCVALEGAAHGVTCNAVSPTWVDTGLMRANVAQLSGDDAEIKKNIAEQNPQKRILQPEETAGLVLYLCSDAAKGVNAENITLSGGATW